MSVKGAFSVLRTARQKGRSLVFKVFAFIAATLATVFAACSYFRNSRRANAAFAPDQPHNSHTDIRDSGPAAMRDELQREWTETDEILDESFPASDPPGGY